MLRVQACGQVPAAVIGPGVAEVFAGVGVLVVVVNSAKPAHQDLQLGGGAVVGDLDQVLNQLLLTWAVEAADRAGLGERQPAGPHLLSQPRIVGKRPGDPDMFERGAVRNPTRVRQPLRGGRQPGHQVTLPRVELPDQQQEP